MKEYMPYDGANDPFLEIDLSELVSGTDEDGAPVLAAGLLQFNPDTIAVPTLPIREPVTFFVQGEEVALLADVTHNLFISESFSNDHRGTGVERQEELTELFDECAVAHYAYRKRTVYWNN